MPASRQTGSCAIDVFAAFGKLGTDVGFDSSQHSNRILSVLFLHSRLRGRVSSLRQPVLRRRHLMGQIMTRTISFQLALLLFAQFMLVTVQKAEASTETAYLIVSDATGRLSNQQIERLTKKAERSLEQILQYWSVSPGIERLGKIQVKFEQPRTDRSGRAVRTAVFLMEKGAGRMIRTVRVFGADGEPQMMVQKIGHAVFPQQDKLVRNMMGIPMEIKFGNRLSFPACGFSIDAWVLALREVNAYIPLARLGPGHESWGMSSRGGLPVVTDQAKQHVTYAEAGSFGDHLLRTYGIAKLKAFNSLSRSGTRPWLEVFKLPLDALEQDWNQALQKREAKDVPLLVRLLKQNPSDACSEARRIAQ